MWLEFPSVASRPRLSFAERLTALSTDSTAVTKGWKPGASDFPVLVERYQILGVLGEGGMGTVFKGYHLNLKRFVAIKTLRVDRRQSTSMVNRFLKEMESVGQMDHPNVVRASDAGEKNGVFYLVMDYLQGSDLGRLVAQKGRLEIATACELTRQTAIGLEHIHRTLIHRDIKPSNLMLTTAGQVKILDLGLARLGFGEPCDGERTPEGCAVGTYAYMAPEQATRGADIDCRADIYSLGCTLFKLLTGQAPFSGPGFENEVRVIYAHCHVPLTGVAAFESVPDPLRSVLLKMMAKNADDRYRSGQEVVDALAPFGADDSLARLLRHSGLTETVDQSPVRPLPDSLPEEILRLTVASQETAKNSVSAALATAVANLFRQRSSRFWAICLCVVALFLAPLGWFLAAPNRAARPDPNGAPTAAATAADWRVVDDLPPRQPVFLLDRKPIALAGASDNSHLFQWNPVEQAVNVLGGDKLLLALGKTARSGFSFEVDISQMPWTGEADIFWGYREDAARKKDEAYKKGKTDGPYFATFQMLKLVQDIGSQKEYVYFVYRVKGQLRYSKAGTLAANIVLEEKQSVMPPRNGIAQLQIEVVDGRPRFAHFNGLLLNDLYSAVVNRNLPPGSSEGAFGLISLNHTAAFKNARFILNSN